MGVGLKVPATLLNHWSYIADPSVHRDGTNQAPGALTSVKAAITAPVSGTSTPDTDD